MSAPIFTLGFGVGTLSHAGNWLEVLFPAPLFNPDASITDSVCEMLGYQGGNQVIEFNFAMATELAHSLKTVAPEQSALLVRLAESHKPTLATILATDQPPTTVPEIYLKLQLISHRLCRPHQLNLSNLYSLLPNVAWTNLGPIALEELAHFRLEERIKGRMLQVFSVDRLPKLTDYVVPEDVQIADAARVRLGAYLGADSKILHEGFVSFNAGCEGSNIIEGRISSGVFVGAHSNLESASRTTNYANQSAQKLIRLGQYVQLHSNASTTLDLGDHVTLEEDLHLYADTDVRLICEQHPAGQPLKAQALAGQDHLRFWKDHATNAIYCQKNN